MAKWELSIRLIGRVAVSAAFFGSLLAGCGPAITKVTPTSGLPGQIITIEGRGFSSSIIGNVVTIGGSPVRMLTAAPDKLRVIALRQLASGPVEVRVGANTLVGPEPFSRKGTTERATSEEDSGPKLIEGQSYKKDRRYDMSAKGTNQKVLVVLCKPSDVDPEALAPSGTSARQSIVDHFTASGPSVNTYFKQASYLQLSANFSVTPDWVALSQVRDFYCWQAEDVNRAQAKVAAAQADLDALQLDPSATQAQIDDATTKLEAAQTQLEGVQNAQDKLQQPDFLFAEALIGAKAAVADFDTYTDYDVIVAGPFLRGQCCWVETGFHAESTHLGLNFDIDFPSPKGLTYVAQEADWGRMAHELSHFFAGGDVYEEGLADGSIIAGTYAPYDLMGNHDSHPLYGAFTRERNLKHYDVSNVKTLAWGSSADLDQTVDLIAHDASQNPTGDATFHLLRLKVTDGLSYYAEVRQRPASGSSLVFDTAIPLDVSNPSSQAGVLISKAVENNNQSNNNEQAIQLVPPARMFQAGDFFTDPARTIRIDVVQKLADRPAKYRVRVQWGHLPAADPNGQFDLRITPWSPPPWETPDIWVNSTKNDETSPPKTIYKNHDPADESIPLGNGDPPWVGHNNTIFARVTNQGTVPTPSSVRVTLYVNSPPGVGDNGTWAPFDVIDIGILNPNETREIPSNAQWRPAKGEHTCVKAYIEPQTGEVTFDNNQAQENFSEFETGSSSPYQPVELDLKARNPYTSPIVMDMRAHNVPREWFVAFDHGSVWLPPKGEKDIHAVIWTDRRAEWVSDRKDSTERKPLIDLEGWADRWADQVFAIGGVTTFVQAVRIDSLFLGVRDKEPRVGGPITVNARISPPSGPAPLAIHLIDPDGKRHVERTGTDATGQVVYTMQYRPTQAGSYQIQGFILGGSIAAEAESEVVRIRVYP